jgi:hypothetical protein
MALAIWVTEGGEDKYVGVKTKYSGRIRKRADALTLVTA